MKTVEKYLIMLFLFALPLVIVAQTKDNYTELEKVVATFQTEQLLSYEVLYLYYDNLSARTPTDSLRMAVMQKGDAYYIKSKDAEILYQNKESILINHTDKQVLYSQINPNEENPRQMIFGGMSIEDLKEQGQEMGLNLVSFEPQGLGDSSGLRFEAPEQSRTKIDFTYHNTIYSLKEINLEIQVENDFASYLGNLQNTKMRILYQKYQNPNGGLKKSIHDFIQKDMGKVNLAKQFNNYELIIN